MSEYSQLIHPHSDCTPLHYITIIVDDNRFTLICMDIRIATGNLYVQYYYYYTAAGTSTCHAMAWPMAQVVEVGPTSFAFWLPPNNKHKQLPMHRRVTADAGG